MDAYAHAADVVRRRDRDRYLAALFAPKSARRHLMALAAFASEVGRAGEAVRDPMGGAIRLQWWRDALAAGEAGGHPIATAVIETARAHALPSAAFEMLLDARSFDLADEPMASLAELEAYAGATAGSLIHLDALVLGAGFDDDGAAAAGHGGVAATLAAVMRGLPRHPARGQRYLPDDLVAAHGLDRQTVIAGRATPELAALLAELRSVAHRHLTAAEIAVARLAPAARPAYLPLAVVGPTLDRLERVAAGDLLARPVELPPWRRQWLIWRAARRR